MAAEANYSARNGNDNMVGPGTPLEKDWSNGVAEHLDNNMDSDNALRRIKTAGSISISPELFEKIYLTPQNAVKGELRKTFGNPTPLALIGFLLSLTPLSCDLMGWRGAGGNGAAGTGTYFFFGGLLMTLGAVGEFIVGNTFPFVVFGSFGAFWLSYGATLQPFYNAYGAYSTTGNAADGMTTVGFQSSFAFFLLTMGFLCFIYMILSLRTNIVFFIIFLTLIFAFCLLAGAYWQMSNNPTSTLPTKLIVAAGAFSFVTCVGGWWIFFAIMLAALDFPFQVPVGDLSHIIKGASDRAKAKEEKRQYSA
ncbi:MAG: hypothetical protein M1820_004535 [Bogoriella megaspora]|nr:MAG: hypothetical protein M1820_004535 [Bogoriella megaspora]